MQILIQQVWAEGLGLGMSNQQPRDGSAAGLGTHLDKHESRWQRSALPCEFGTTRMFMAPWQWVGLVCPAANLAEWKNTEKSSSEEPGSSPGKVLGDSEQVISCPWPWRLSPLFRQWKQGLATPLQSFRLGDALCLVKSNSSSADRRLRNESFLHNGNVFIKKLLLPVLQDSPWWHTEKSKPV